jgi:hypothetical protein
MTAPTSSILARSHRKSAIALLLVAGGLTAAMPARAQIDPSIKPVANEASDKKIIPCIKNKTRGLTPCVKTRNVPGAIVPCVKTKTGAIAPCVKTKTVVTAPVSP